MQRHMASPLALAIGCVLATAVPCEAQSTVNLHVQIESDAQGPIVGDAPTPLGSNQITALEFHHQVAMLSKGIPEHKQVIWTKRVDISSVNLWRAFRDEEILLTVDFHHWDGTLENELMTVSLANARILAIETYQEEGGRPYERIRMNYATFQVTQP